MTDMLEKIARAIADKDGKRFAGHSLYDQNPELFLRLARAALLAMREVDEDMAKAGEAVEEQVIGTFGCVEPEGAFNEGGPALLFVAMIDAILKKGGE